MEVEAAETDGIIIRSIGGGGGETRVYLGSIKDIDQIQTSGGRMSGNGKKTEDRYLEQMRCSAANAAAHCGGERTQNPKPCVACVGEESESVIKCI